MKNPWTKVQDETAKLLDRFEQLLDDEPVDESEGVTARELQEIIEHLEAARNVFARVNTRMRRQS